VYDPPVTFTASAPQESAVPSLARAPTTSRQHGLDMLRVLAICGVVAIHVLGADDSLRGTVHWTIATSITRSAYWAVPVFIMISGALTLNPRAHAAGPAAFYRRRFARILPAMVVWHLVYIVFIRMYLNDERFTASDIASMFIKSKFFTALYFLWLIAGLYVLAPFLVAFLKDGGEGRARITAAIALAWSVVAIMIPGISRFTESPQTNYLGSLNMWWPYVGYFLAGWALRDVRLRWGGIAVAIALGASATGEIIWQKVAEPDIPVLWALLPIDYVGPMTAVAALSIFAAGVSIGARVRLSPRLGRWLRALSEASFGVFLVHLLILVLLRHWLPQVQAARSLPVMLGAYAVVLAASFGISLTASRVPYLRAVF
jgi:surface polysaccharide O-acyltransferase-like enzyme